MSNPIKNPTTYKQQLDKLKLRGCITKNDAFCMSVLKAVSYYRLSAYFLPFKNNDDTYVKGTNFEQVFDIYEFDRKLRRIIFSAIEEIEVFTRAAFGMLSFFFADLTTKDQKEIARTVFHTTANNIKSLLRCCTDLRNICAHYGSIYYRNFPSVPAGFKTDNKDKYKLWTIIQVVKELYYDAEKWNTSILKPMIDLFEEYKNDINLTHMAFPSNWIDLLTKK